MPQMSPLMWFSLFIIFSITLILFNQMNFFSYKPLIFSKTKSELINMKNMNWKW
uniref:ATP synthase complex subunit 8 n=3 Tax=Acrididae TaxID=7002 RepID=A0A384V1R9_9ORTH|nr:ATP synthase F0 subunit 8 [Oxya hyla]YP_009515612.1 ATP synthase F0 subunit 8 [Dnopherula yuanmowensis]AKF02251.1 ATP synthase F0 subunit 8 [Oxya hyla intricata]APD14931.1 ATP synthase F0 subunit 8 [Oxya hyla]AST09095.1 ATP synthase F0 subunit 8 [Dnopherula yuanmowensis]